ncbi:MAG: 16S rRNA (uracil(1498)-N(3))-methyltransferase [Verrucomicrobiales bacterium]|nr:16S rRNA (uracil(1498)-N(3))-methyltransferase [Verrucomicrobiales bacterium]
MSLHRFFIPPDRWNPENPALDEEEAHHCTDVLRLKPGDRVVVFNGQGVESAAEILTTGRHTVLLKTHSVQKTPPPPARITLCQAIPKGKNMELIIEKATELGVAEIIPVLSERTVVRLDPGEAQKKQEKWQRTAVGACKQCGQNWLPHIGLPVGMDRLLAAKPAADLLLIAAIEEGAQRLHRILAEQPQRPGSALICIGPEGDFTPAEVGMAKSYGCQPMTLGPIILRTETAAIFSVSILAHELF